MFHLQWSPSTSISTSSKERLGREDGEYWAIWGGTESNVSKFRIVFISTGQQEPRDGKKYKTEEGKRRGALKKDVVCHGMLMGTKDFKLKQKQHRGKSAQSRAKQS